MPPAKIRNATNILMELRKICQHPYLSAPEMEDLTLTDERQHKELVQSSGKLAFLKILLPKLKAKGHRVLLFSQFKIALDRIQDFLYGEGYAFLRLDGDAPQAQRQKDMDAFNAPDSEIFIFLLTTRAGGVGINLATADTVIVYDPDFNPHQDLQAIARSHRYGQKKKVLVFKLMTKDSVEEQIIQSGKRKMVLDHLVVQNLGKDGGDEAEIDTMLLHGARALYETNADGTSSTDVTYSSRQVDEMIDRVERQAEEEAEVLREKWEKEDAMTEEEKREAMVNRSSETMDFSFAKIWETERGDLAEIEEEEEGADDDRVEADLEDELRIVQENAQKAREKQMAEDLERDRRDRRKKVDYAVEQDLSPKKKKWGRKGKGKEKMVDSAAQSSDSEFQIDARDASGDEDDDAQMGLDAIPEDVRVLLDKNDHAALLAGPGKRKNELTELQRKALRKKFAEMAAQSTSEHGVIVEGPYTKEGLPPSLFLDVGPKRSKRPDETPEQRAIRKAEKKQKQLARVLEAQGQMRAELEKRGLPQGDASAPDPSTGPAVVPAGPVAGPSITHRNPSPPKRPPQAPPSTMHRNPSPPKRPQAPPLVDAARQAMIDRDIAHGQATIDRLWHELERFGLHDNKMHWASMALPDKPFADRMGLYWGLATTVDALRARVGEPAHFTDPSIRPQLEVLFNQSAPGVAPGARARPMSSQVNGSTNGSIARPAVAARSGNAHVTRPPVQQASQALQSQGVAGPPTNITRPELRPQPAPKRTVHLKSSIRPPPPANIATPAAAPPRSLGVNPPRPSSAATFRPIPPLPVGSNAANSSQMTPSVNGEPPLRPGSASTRPSSATLQSQRSGSGSAPPSATPTPTHQPHWATMPRTHLQYSGNAYPNAQAGPSRHSPVTPTIIHPPPLLPPQGVAPRTHDAYGQPLFPPCEMCRRPEHATRDCPRRDVVPQILQLKEQLITALKGDLSPEHRRVFEGHVSEVDRRLRLHERLAREDAQLGLPPRTQAHASPNGFKHLGTPQPLLPFPSPIFAPVVQGPEGRSKETAIAIDDDDDLPGSSAQAPRQPLAMLPTIQPALPAPATLGNGIAAPAAQRPSYSTRSNGNGIHTNGGGDPVGPPPYCPACKTQSSHPLHRCPFFIKNPDKIRAVVSRMADDDPLKDKIQSAIEKFEEETKCPMCGALDCKLDLRACIEQNGGRQALKAAIRRLDAERERKGQEATPALQRLYEVYKTWPREQDERSGKIVKKVKREQ